MISYEKVNCSKFIDFSGKGVKCMICGYSYSSDGFKCQPYVCNEFSMTVINLSDFFILNIKDVDYKVYISGIDKKDAVNILSSSVLDDKGVL